MLKAKSSLVMALPLLIWSGYMHGYSNESSSSCIDLKKWEKKAEIQGHFLGNEEKQTVELWYKPQKGPFVEDRNEAALVLIEKGKCITCLQGYRDQGEIQYPHVESSISAVELYSNLDLIQSVSRYSHQFSEKITVFFIYDIRSKKFKKAWEGWTESVSPSGEKSMRTLFIQDLNKDHFKDFFLKNGQETEKWLWNKRKKIFIMEK